MPYSHFKTLSSAIDAFELDLHEESFFPELKSIVPSNTLRLALEDSLPVVATSSEKARSEGLIYPVLMEARRILNKQVSLFSGEEFMVDEAAGLTGIVDFLMSRSPQISTIQACDRVCGGKESGFTIRVRSMCGGNGRCRSV